MRGNVHHSTKAFVVLLTLLLMVCAVVSAIASDNKATPTPNCDIQAGPCAQTLGEGTVTLDILPRPVKAMTDLTFQATFENVTPTGEPAIDLGMPGMSMGPNHVVLKEAAAGVYTGTGVIVRCPSGRTLWEAKVTVPGVGTAAFTFNVIY